jgi:hypothetical protein
MPPVTTSLVEAACQGNPIALSEPAAKLAEEAIKMMPYHPLNLKWIAAAFLTACVGGAALGTWLIGNQPREMPPFASTTSKTVSANSSEQPDPKPKDPVKPKVISPEIIEAWVKAGARFGHFKRD